MALKDFIKARENELLSSAPDVSHNGVVPIIDDILMTEFKTGVVKPDECHIKSLDAHFCWRRTDQNCWTGYPNDGKTTFLLFLMIVKAYYADWVFCLWSPEMRSATFAAGKVVINYNSLINEIVWMFTGKTPYKHVHERYRVPMIEIDEFISVVEWVKKHFIFIDPIKKTPEAVHELLMKVYEDKGFDAIIIDPFKNVHQDPKSAQLRDDVYLDRLFDTFKDLAVRTNSVMNWIAHPKSGVTRIKTTKGHDQLMACDQYMLAGGAAWDNGMDGIYTTFRPNLLESPTDPEVMWINLKQRRQELTRPRGKVTGITLNIKERYYDFGYGNPLKFRGF